MASKNAPFYSCKFNQDETVCSHRTKAAAIRKAGDFGMIFDSATRKELQVHLMSDGKLRAFPEGDKRHEHMNFSFLTLLVKSELIT